MKIYGKPFMKLDAAEQQELIQTELASAYARSVGLTESKIKELNLDAATQSIFFEGELKDISKKQYETLYAPLDWSLCMGVRPVAKGMRTAGYRIYDQRGAAAIISDYAVDGPAVDISADEVTTKLFDFSDSFRYSDRELDAASLTGVSLDGRKLTAAKRAMDEKMNTHALLGNTALGIQGLLKMSGVSITAASGTFDSLTPDEMATDLFTVIDAVRIGSKKRFNANTVLADSTIMSIISSTQRSTGTDMTVLQYVQKNRPGVQFIEIEQCATASAAGARRIMAYENSAQSDIALQVQEAFVTLPPERRAFSMLVNCRAAWGSCEMPYRICAAYLDGV